MQCLLMSGNDQAQPLAADIDGRLQRYRVVRVGTRYTEKRACAEDLEYSSPLRRLLCRGHACRGNMALFKKSDDDDRLGKVPLPRIGESWPVRSNNAPVIASTRLFKGKRLVTEGLVIEGHLECTTAHHQKHLTVGEHSWVKADIHANTVTVLGHLIGDIYCKGMVSLAKGSVVIGDIFCVYLFIEEGARFEGKIDMGKTPNVAATPKNPM